MLDLSSSAALLLTAFLLVGAVATYAMHRRRRERRDAARFSKAKEANLHIPPSLHPLIDPDVCIGSLACVQACPEGDILGIVDSHAKLIHGANCIGHGRCAAECPMNAIKLVFGTSERGVDLPEIDQYFESSRRGVHIVGELGGMGLIKNAFTQGLQLAEHLATELGSGAGQGMGVDVAIVGAGPAGLATALGLRQAGLTFEVLEQDTLGGTIAHYPRKKLVMTEPVVLPFHGKFAKKTILKEELLEGLNGVLAEAEVSVREGMKVSRVDGQDGAFTVHTEQGRAVAARKVVLAVGRRGTPRKLGVPGEDHEKVVYRLTEPEQYEGDRVLVVGGGDSALEAAIALADCAEVTVSYRQPAFGRCRDANREKVEALVAEGRVRTLMGSQVTQIHEDHVELVADGKPVTLENDAVVVCIGGELPLEFLKSVGVEVKRHHGTAPAATAKGGGEAESREEAAVRSRRRLAFGLFTLGALVVASLAVVGWEYYLLPGAERHEADLHATLKPAGIWGHGVGVVATVFMLSNFLYATRKRLDLLRGLASIRSWLTFHMFVGFMSPLVIAFHAAFQVRNGLAAFTYLALGVVVATGIIGRFIYGLVPSRGGLAVDHAELRGLWERRRATLEPLLRDLEDPEPVRNLFRLATDDPPHGSLVVHLLRRPIDWISVRVSLLRVRSVFGVRYPSFRESILALMKLRAQLGFFRSLKRLLSVWRSLHAVLAIFLVLAIAAHVGITTYLGYWWIFK